MPTIAAVFLAEEKPTGPVGFIELASDTQIGNVASRASHLRCGFAETKRRIKLKKRLI